MTRKTARDLVFKIIYQADIQKEPLINIYDIVKDEYNIDDNSKDYIISTLDGISDNSENINKIISEKSVSWKLNRISKISLACLKLGIFELLYNNEIPNTVAINESVDIAKLYEGENSAKFVNGILSVVLKENV